MSAISAASLFRVDGLVAVVTGGASGIGLTMARALAENGAAKVYVVGRRQERLDAAAALHPAIIGLQGDVTSKDDLERLAARVQQDVGHLHLLVANAGITGPGFLRLAPDATLDQFVDHAWATPMQEINDVFALNFTAQYYTVLAFMKLLGKGNARERRFSKNVRSQVIMTASTASYIRKVRVGVGYSGSKAALVALSKSLASMCVPYGIRFNALAPGLFMSDLAVPLIKAHNLPEGQDPTEEGAFPQTLNPAERLGSERDMAGTLLYMASEAGAFINGSVNLLDGGALANIPSTY